MNSSAALCRGGGFFNFSASARQRQNNRVLPQPSHYRKIKGMFTKDFLES
jgi:hypothetical protein